jgi:hypothetical protein
MYNQEHKIAQAEHMAFVANFNKPAVEGLTVQVPNTYSAVSIIDRMVITLKHALADLAGSQRPEQLHRTGYSHGAAAK